MATQGLFLCKTPNPDALYRLYIFPAVGVPAGAYGHIQHESLEVHVLSINYVGCKVIHDDLETLTAAIRTELMRCDVPYCVFGHSLGATIVHHLTCVTPPSPAPVAAIVTARPPPLHDYPAADRFSQMDRIGKIARLRAMGGTPEEVLRDDGIIDSLLPLLTASFKINDGYATIAAKQRAPCTQLVYLNPDSDFPLCTTLAEQWTKEVPGTKVVALPGDHFWPRTPEGGRFVSNMAMQRLE